MTGSLVLTACATNFDLPFNPNDERPNFLIILTDDQRFDTMQYMPKTQALIFDQGVTFTHGYVNSPLCGPSRANILTGMHVHHHNVTTNTSELTIGTIIEDFQKSGYYTGLVGKFINEWKGEPRPEYDYWVSIFRDASRYYDPDINVNGTWKWQTPGYITDIFGDYVVEFLDKASKKSKPFLLYFAPNAPHAPTQPAEEDKSSYADLPPHRPPNFNEDDVSDKPYAISSRPLFNDEDIARIEKFRRRQILTLLSLDRNIEKIINKLDEIGELDSTVIIYLSDNGKLWGEHRLESKGAVYEESIRVPFGLRYPPLVPQAYTEDQVVGSIDIAPTLYELAGLPVPDRLDGLSLVSLLRNEEWRKEMFLECWPSRGHWTAIHTGRYKYVESENDISEFYDLEVDPYELENLIDDPNYQDLIAELQAALEKEKQPEPSS